MSTRRWMLLAAAMAVAMTLWRASWAGQPWQAVSAVTFSSDGRMLAAGLIGGMSYCEDFHYEIGEVRQSLSLFDAASGTPKGELEPMQFAGRVRGIPSSALGSFLDFAPNSDLLAVGRWDGEVHLWDASSHQRFAELQSPFRHVSSVRFAHEGRTLVAGCRDALIFWDTAQPGTSRQSGTSTIDASSLAIAPGSDRIAVGANSSALGAQLWELNDARLPKRTIPIAGDLVLSLAFAPDGRTLALGGEETALLWDVFQERVRFEVPGPWSVAVAISPDGETLAAAGVDGLRFWSTATGEPAGGNPRLRALRSLVYSPDGRLLAAGDDDGSVTVWEMPTGRRLWSAKLPTDWALPPILVLCLVVAFTLPALTFGDALWNWLPRLSTRFGRHPCNE